MAESDWEEPTPPMLERRANNRLNGFRYALNVARVNRNTARIEVAKALEALQAHRRWMLKMGYKEYD